jgi:hypothetical protein
MFFLKNFLQRYKAIRQHHAIQRALGLQHLGDGRRDGLTLNRASHRLQIEWQARGVHPWDRTPDSEQQDHLFAEQSAADADAVLTRLFEQMPAIDVIEFRVIHPETGLLMIAGTVDRSVPVAETRAVSGRTRLWRRGVTTGLFSIAALALLSSSIFAQSQTAPASPAADASSTSTDLFVMIGSDFDRPGLVPRANLNIGIGHTFGFLKKDPIGDELTFGYTYENAGTHGFFHTAFGEHTESVGVMKNFSLPKTKTVTGYTWLQTGITTYTGSAHLQNELDTGVALGAIVHFNNNNSVWLQEMYSKVVTVPWYTTSSIGYTYSW